MSKIVVVGAGKIADEAFYYLTGDSEHDVVAFTVEAAYVGEGQKLGLPVVAFEEVERLYPPSDYKMFVAIAYHDLNRVRARLYDEAKAKGYELISYVSSMASNVGNVPIGDNCFILEFVTLQPCSKVGNNVFLWSGNHVGHHATIEDHCYIAGKVVISGSTVIEPFCFLGVSSTIGHEIRVGEGSFIGAGTLVTKTVEPKSVYIAPDTPKFRLDADMFLRLTKMK